MGKQIIYEEVMLDIPKELYDDLVWIGLQKIIEDKDALVEYAARLILTEAANNKKGSSPQPPSSE